MFLLQLAAWTSLSQFRKHPGMEDGKVLLWVSGAQGSNSRLMASSLSPTVPSWGKLHPTGLSCLQPYCGFSPTPLNVSKQAPLGRTGALDFKWENCMHTLSSVTHLVCHQKGTLCPRPFLPIQTHCQGLRLGSHHFQLRLQQPLISYLLF